MPKEDRRRRSLSIESCEPRWLLTAQLFADIEARNIGSDPGLFTPVGDKVLFVAHDSEPRNDGAGFQLYASDGTTDGTITLGRFDAHRLASHFYAAGSSVYFAVTGPHGENEELWRSDGTVDGTTPIQQLEEPASYRINSFAPLGDELLFFRGRGPHAGLWKTAGSEPTRISDAIGGVEDPVAINDWLFFQSVDEVHGKELWRTDGTAAGTQLIKDIHPGRDGADIRLPRKLGDQLLFFADDGEAGLELWSSDGTADGTQMLRDLSPGQDGNQPAGTFPTWSVASDEVLYFSASGGSTGRELYRSDGTADGTFLLRDIKEGNFGSDPFPRTIMDSQLLFDATGTERGTWITDGTPAGTQPFEASEEGYPWSPEQVTSLVDAVYVNVGDQNGFLSSFDLGNGQRVLGFDDGTPAGLQPIAGPDGEYSSQLTEYEFLSWQDQVFYAADDGLNGPELWTTDGTFAGTQMLKNIANPRTLGSDPRHLAEIDGLVYAIARGSTRNDHGAGSEVWVSDGTAPGTRLLRDIFPGPNGQDTTIDPQFTKLGDDVIFLAKSAAQNYELWKTDGTEAGTALVREIRAGNESSFPDPRIRAPRFTVLHGEAYFVADDGRGENLWKTDGTHDGTQMVYRLRRDGQRINLTDIVVYRDAVYFSAHDGINGQELWRTEGTAESTEMLTRVIGVRGAGAQYLTVLGDRLFFAGSEPATGTELWMSDGTREGTQLLADIQPGMPSSAPMELTAVDDQLFFTRELSGSSHQLWSMDVDTLQPYLVQRFERRFDPYRLTAVDGRLFFLVNEDGQRIRLWTSDGTPQGTAPMSDLVWEWPFAVGDVFAVGSKLGLEVANRELEEAQIWFSDGTSERTSAVQGIVSGGDVHVSGDILYVQADDGQSGEEIWTIDWQHPPVPQVHELIVQANSVAAQFTHDVSASLMPEALSLVRAATQESVPTAVSLQWDADTLTAVWQFENAFAPGEYRLTIDSSEVQNAAGDPLDGNHDFVGGDDHRDSFIISLPGDANRDGAVKFDDFLILASNFGQPVERSTGGDFDGNARVDFADFLVLALHYGQQQEAGQ